MTWWYKMVKIYRQALIQKSNAKIKASLSSWVQDWFLQVSRYKTHPEDSSVQI
jgi:hypothetical protein